MKKEIKTIQFLSACKYEAYLHKVLNKKRKKRKRNIGVNNEKLKQKNQDLKKKLFFKGEV